MPNLLPFLLIAIFMLETSIATRCIAKPAASPIRVAIYADAGSSKSALPNLNRCLSSKAEFAIETVNVPQIIDGQLRDFDVVIFPGGRGSRQGAALGSEGVKRVRDFVAAGGGYVGICAGAYLSTSQFTWSLGLLDAKVIDHEHWARGTGTVQLKLTPAGQELFRIHASKIDIYYGQGPLLAVNIPATQPICELLAIYETEVAKKNAPTGVMQGTAAIVRGHFGKGRVVAISPHPEKTNGRDEIIRQAVLWSVD